MTIDELFREVQRLCYDEDKTPHSLKPYALSYETKNIQIKIRTQKTSYHELLEQLKFSKRYKLLQEAGDIKEYGKLQFYIDDEESDSKEQIIITSSRTMNSESSKYSVTLQSGTSYPYVKFAFLEFGINSQIYPFIYPSIEGEKQRNTTKLINKLSDKMFLNILQQPDANLFEEIYIDLDYVYTNEETMVDTFEYFYPKLLMLPDKRELKKLPRLFSVYLINCL
ncbi:hypothetical protein [Mesotoga prima]|uniref:hypothetical protein n=1 Tax=Mesotoga prima TaxID=1184387 RepID=UPI002FD886C5